MAGINARVAYILGGGVVGRCLGGTGGGGIGGGLVSRRSAWRVDGLTGGTLDGRMVGGALGLQLLATTVSSSLSLSERMWNGLLFCVSRRWTNGICLMALVVVMLFDVVATLGGGVVTTLGHGASTLLVGASTVGGVVRCPAMIAVSFWMARMCLIFLEVIIGTVPPNTLRRSAAATMERSSCEATGTWQWAGYKCQVLEKRKRCMAGM
jgi:hypothetical protein